MKHVKNLIHMFISCTISLYGSQYVLADTIYQWTDQWGQVRYSKTPVPGSMISELTKLPETQEYTEQQKQEAMLRKIQKIQNNNKLKRQKQFAEKSLRLQNRRNEEHCRNLHNMLTDVRLRRSRYHYFNYYPGSSYYQGRNYYPGIYFPYRDDFLEQDLYWQVRKFCR